MHDKSTEWVPQNQKRSRVDLQPRTRKPWKVPSLVIIDIEEETGNGGSSGTDGKGGSETGITAS